MTKQSMFPRNRNGLLRSARNDGGSGTCALRQKLLPVRAAQHPHYGGCYRGALAPGDAIKVHRAPRVEPVDAGALQGRRDRGGVRKHSDTDIGLQELDQVALRGNFVASIDVDAMLAQRIVQPVGMFAVVSRQQLLVSEILETDLVATRQRVLLVDDKIKAFGE